MNVEFFSKKATRTYVLKLKIEIYFFFLFFVFRFFFFRKKLGELVFMDLKTYSRVRSVKLFLFASFSMYCGSSFVRFLFPQPSVFFSFFFFLLSSKKRRRKIQILFLFCSLFDKSVRLTPYELEQDPPQQNEEE